MVEQSTLPRHLLGAPRTWQEMASASTRWLLTNSTNPLERAGGRGDTEGVDLTDSDLEAFDRDDVEEMDTTGKWNESENELEEADTQRDG